MTPTRILTASLAFMGLALSPSCAQETAEAAPEAQPVSASSAPALTMDDVNAAPEDWREVDADNLLIFETTKGRIVIEMLPEVAPKHVEQFRAIAKSGDFDGTIFHRVIDDFMAQGGDIFALKGRESGLPNIPAEFTFRRNPAEMPVNLKGNPQEAKQGLYKGFPIATQSQFLAEMTADGSVDSWVLHCPGVVSTARTNDPNSANSQFFLMRYKADHLDKQYTAWFSTPLDRGKACFTEACVALMRVKASVDFRQKLRRGDELADAVAVVFFEDIVLPPAIQRRDVQLGAARADRPSHL